MACTDRRTAAVTNVPPSSAGPARLLRLQIQLLGCCGSAVQGLHIYGSVVEGAGGGGGERRTQRQWKDGCRGPGTIGGAGGAEATAATGEASLSAPPRL